MKDLAKLFAVDNKELETIYAKAHIKSVLTGVIATIRLPSALLKYTYLTNSSFRIDYLDNDTKKKYRLEITEIAE